MTFFNPLSGSLVPATPAKRAADKDRQIARSQALQKNAAAEGDRLEHSVESAEELHPAGDQAGGGNGQQSPQQAPPKKKPKPPAEDPDKPRIDVKA
jgi:hypothetical protein